MPTSQPNTQSVDPSAAAANGVSPSRPIITRSVVTTAICASCVAARGTASLPKARISASHGARRGMVGGCTATGSVMMGDSDARVQ